MNFDGFGGLALAVVAGLWLLVFVPSWFKRAQDRERGISPAPRVSDKSARTVRRGRAVRRGASTNDNFSAIAADYAAAALAEASMSRASSAQEIAEVDPRAWERSELPAPLARLGTLETPILAGVVSFEEKRATVIARTLSQGELDEILRRRRSNG